MLVVGAEAMLAPGPFLAWHALHVLAPQREDAPEESCRPFSADRSGLVLGEGAVAIVLESADTARDREVTPLAEFVGYGTTCDAHHLTKPASSGQISAMRQAIADAEVDIAEIGYVNAHGTATRAGDTIEAESLNALFKDCIRFPLVSATKSMHGHLLGASGALEFMLTVLAVQNDSVPPTLHLNDVDPLLAGIDFVPHKARKVNKLEVAMSNSFAFGGANVSLLVRKWDRPMDIPENKSRQQNSRAELGSGRASRA
jgi:3-oxoacyl-[acyl-carrier-protein] synthase II